ncbi:MAG: cyclic nucleotide-binding domain-containing protein [Deltaproteobacteria bacterium]|nr:cyclic nucleotide-binding domain-containing protein [Deltaproteobacteria bacterium]
MDERAIEHNSSDAAATADAPFLRDVASADDRSILARFLVAREVAQGEILIARGADDRTLYVLTAGAADVVRDGLEVGTLGPGDHFGELGLIAGRPRAASIVATQPGRVLCLSMTAFNRLTVEHPDTALRLLLALVGGVAHRLETMTDTVAALMADRSLRRRAEVQVRLGDREMNVRCGVPVGTLLPAAVGDRPVVAALVNCRVEGLGWPITTRCHVQPLTADHPEGQLVWRQSLALVLLEAAWRIDPALHLVMGYSVGYGQRIDVLGPVDGGLERLARRLQEQACGLIAAGVRSRQEWWSVEEALDHFAERGWRGTGELLRTWFGQRVALCTYGEVYALALTPLCDDARPLGGFHIHADDDGLLLQYPRAADGQSTGESGVHGAAAQHRELQQISRLTVDMTSPHGKWLAALGITSVGAFNAACIQGNVAGIIRVAEGFQERGLIDIADRIARPAGRGRRPRIVTIAGPSSSGKTTFIERLNVQLQVCGLRPVGLSLDNYYCDRADTPRDARGEFDFESLQALRLPLLRDHVEALLGGATVQTARFDFHDGKSLPVGGPLLELGDDGVLLMEGIHGLNPQLLAGLAGEEVFSIFICPLAQLPFDRLSRVHASDVRLLRRIVRDRHGRNHNAESTILRWPSVRAGERQHIMPYQHLASAVFDSSLLYELSVLKVYAQRYLLEVPQDHEAFATAARLLGLLDRFVTIYPDHVPPTSILREFIGASGFEY